MQLFTEADASIRKLQDQTAVTIKEAIAAKPLQPSTAAAGPKGLASTRLRADREKLEAKLDTTQAQLEAVQAEANVAATAAGAAFPTVALGNRDGGWQLGTPRRRHGGSICAHADPDRVFGRGMPMHRRPLPLFML